MNEVSVGDFFDELSAYETISISIVGQANGKFLLKADLPQRTIVHARPNGKNIEFEKIEHALSQVQCWTEEEKIILDIKNWIN